MVERTMRLMPQPRHHLLHDHLMAHYRMTVAGKRGWSDSVIPMLVIGAHLLDAPDNCLGTLLMREDIGLRRSVRPHHHHWPNRNRGAGLLLHLPPLSRIQLLLQALLHLLGLLLQAPLHLLGLLPQAALHLLGLLLDLLYSPLRIPRALPELNAPLLHNQHLHLAVTPQRSIRSPVARVRGSDDNVAHAAGPGSAAC
jgi:hypothetical protein